MKTAWTDLPDLISSGLLNIYVPASGALPTIGVRSAIVGPAPDGSSRIRIDFEGGLQGAPDHADYEGRLHSAAGRHLTSYPTIARIWAKADELVAVGLYDGAAHRIERLDAPEVLANWLAPEPLAWEVAPADSTRLFMRLRSFAHILPPGNALSRVARYGAANIAPHAEAAHDLQHLARIYESLGLHRGLEEINMIEAWLRGLRTPARHASETRAAPRQT